MEQRAPIILETVDSLRTYVRQARLPARRIALVPTMGALHDGHIELVRTGLAQADHVIVSIFVNPTQFGPNEDFSAYPSTWDADLARLTDAGAHAVFHPSVDEIYPPGAATTVSVRGITDPLEGAARPGHFDGMATIVTKLLLMALPDIALFGEKDFQQLQVVKRLVTDLNIPTTIIGVPTVRDDHGLALSSRNAYLDDAQRTTARQMNQILAAIAARAAAGGSMEILEREGSEALLQAGFDQVDYLKIADAETLAAPAPDQPTRPRRILAAAKIGRTRLIDNMAVPSS